MRPRTKVRMARRFTSWASRYQRCGELEQVVRVDLPQLGPPFAGLAVLELHRPVLRQGPGHQLE